MLWEPCFCSGLGGARSSRGPTRWRSIWAAPEHAAALKFPERLFSDWGAWATPFILANLLHGNSTRLVLPDRGGHGGHAGRDAGVHMPQARSAGGIALSEAGKLLSHPALWLLAAMLFLYVACEVGVWNWLTRHLIRAGDFRVRAFEHPVAGLPLGLLIGRVAVTPLFKTVRPDTGDAGAAVLMTVTTWLALRTTKPAVAWVAVFAAGIAHGGRCSRTVLGDYRQRVRSD